MIVLKQVQGTETLRKAPPRYGSRKMRANYSRKVMVEGKGFVSRRSLFSSTLPYATLQNAAESSSPRDNTRQLPARALLRSLVAGSALHVPAIE